MSIFISSIIIGFLLMIFWSCLWYLSGFFWTKGKQDAEDRHSK
jgi:hypothetical protein